ncbi:MAG: LysR family transcriptional regulator [Eggerthellaceae bacterium]
MEADFQRCRAFVVAAEVGSYSEASKALGYSVSSVSRMIADLERTCGFKVLEKGRFGVRPTLQGAELLPHARRIVSECSRFSEVAEMICDGGKGVVRIGSISSVGMELLPRMMGDYLRSKPGVSFEVTPGDYRQIENMVRSGQVDFGTVRDPVPADLESCLLFEDELVAVLPQDHALAQRDFVTVDDLAGSPFIALEKPESGLSEVADLMGSAAVRFEPAFSVWDDFAAMAMVEAGLGVAVLPETMMLHARFDLAVVPIRPSNRRSVYLAWRSSAELGPAARAFLEIVQ